jgi:protein-disulfide isomerase
MRHLSLLLVVSVLWATHALAAPCDKLSADQKGRAHKLFASTYPYDCCDETLDRCLKQKKVCKLAKRLRDDICRRLKRGQKDKQIRSSLERRARSMTPFGKKASIDLSGAPGAGDDKAKVTVVAYACARCPYCSKVVPDLYRLVTRGGLKGKARLVFKTFPIRSHKGSVEGGLAFLAAHQLGKFWPYLLKLYGEFDRFSDKNLVAWAGQLGLERKVFEKKLADKKNRKLLVDIKKEGLRNGVNSTPTLFINGRRYHGDLDHDTLLDVLEEEHDRVSKRQYCGK